MHWSSPEGNNQDNNVQHAVTYTKRNKMALHVTFETCWAFNKYDISNRSNVMVMSEQSEIYYISCNLT
jgi:hypothetical protein